MIYMLANAWLDAIDQSWVASLANFTLQHRSGKGNVNVDALSRIPWEESQMVTLDPKAIKAIGSSCLLQTKSLSVIEAYVSCNPLAVKFLLVTDVVETPSKFTNKQWKVAQRADKAIAQVINYLQKIPDTKVERKLLSVEAHGMLRPKNTLVLKSECCIGNLLVGCKINPCISFCSWRSIDSKLSQLVMMMFVIQYWEN